MPGVTRANFGRLFAVRQSLRQGVPLNWQIVPSGPEKQRSVEFFARDQLA